MNILDVAFIDRQHAMMGCGVTPAQIKSLMSAPEAMLTKSIADGRARAAVMTGDDLIRAEKLIRAFEIELEIRRGGVQKG